MSAVSRWLDQRIGLGEIRTSLLDRRVPHRLTWWHTLGSATLAVFVVQVVTGTVLAMYYSPSPDHAYNSIRFIQGQVVSGALLRGIHHWGASAMVVLVVAHMIRVFTMGAYKYPREVNWLLGVGLFLIVMGFSFTGYLLPWDQKAYWATEVGTNIAGTTPVMGDMLLKLFRGGTQLGAATLTRFYALHVLLLPVLLGTIVGLHLFLVIRQGIAARAAELETGAPPRTTDAGYPAFYEASYKRAKQEDIRFWPDIIAKDAIVAMVVIVVIVLLGAFAGAPLEAPADPADTSYVPRPEWYFLPFFQLLKLVPGSMESAVAVGVPAALVIAMLMLPFFDRASARSFAHRPLSRLSLLVLLGGSGLLIGASVQQDIAQGAVPPEVGRPLSSAERAGRATYHRQQCGSCHTIAGDKSVEKSEEAPDAPELTDVGLKHSGAWLHSFVEDPSRFHADSKMPAFGPPTLSHQEIEELSRYLMTLRGPNGWDKQPEYRDTFPEPSKPKDKA
jgi:ubiquinol-cytochrome c reductase cytochrome b subunit